jgi:broad specificity phosphatase PhoE
MISAMTPAPSATRLLVVRHGQTDWNRDERWQGHGGPGLNDRGRRQAVQLAARLRRLAPVATYASDLRRAVETAHLLTGADPTLEPRLREVDVGSWTGLTREEVAERDPGGYARWAAGETGWSDGETYQQMHDRVAAVVDELADRHTGETILLVAHGGTVRATAAHAVGLPGHDRRRIQGAANCSLTVVERAIDGGLALLSFNERSHLVC